MSNIPNCTQCSSAYVYEYNGLFTCPECGYEYTKEGDVATEIEDHLEVKVLDANGNELKDGDAVVVIKDLKVKGSSSVVKIGTKVKNIRLTNGDHNIDCKIPGVGAMGLKSEFVKKVTE